jgi:flagellar basal body-associated protein FliL
MSDAAAPPPAKKSRKLIWAVVCLLGVGGGVAVPMVVPMKMFAKGKTEAKPNGAKGGSTAIVPFGDVVANLDDERMSRYLRVKLAVVVDADAEKEVTDRVAKKKAAVKSTLIATFSSKKLKDVAGKDGVQRLQRESLEKFDDVLYPDGESKLRDVLFEEYVVQ